MAESTTVAAEPKLTALAQNILDELQEQDAKGLEDPALSLAALSDAVMRTEKLVDEALRFELEPAGLVLEVDKDRWCIPADPEDIGEAGWVADEGSLVTLPEDQPEPVAEDAEPVNWQLLPPLTSEEYSALKEDIGQRGVLVPVEVDEAGNLLDGHHRMRAVAELRSHGVNIPEPKRIVRKGWSDQQKRQHVYTINLARRALTREQKQEIAGRLRGDGWTLEAVARALGVSLGTAHSWTKPIFSSENEATITNARGQERPASYAPREHPQLDAVLGGRPPETTPESYQDHTETIPAEQQRHAGMPSAPCLSTVTTGGRDDWATPQVLFDVLHAEFDFELDVAAEHGTAKLPDYFTSAVDGLAQSWAPSRCFMNPPYGHGVTSRWLEKAHAEAMAGALVVALVPAAVGAAYFRRWCEAAEVRFITGRLRFDDGDNPATFNSVVVVFRPGLPPEHACLRFWDGFKGTASE